jgi:hypothetical protein
MVFLITAIISSVVACIALNKPGVSREMRKLLVGRHIVYIFFFLISNFYYAFNAFIFIQQQKWSDADESYKDSVLISIL